MRLPLRHARRGAVTFDLLSLLVVSGLAAGALWPDRDPVQTALDTDARAVVNALLDGRRAARVAAKPMLVEVDPMARIVRVAVDRDGDGLMSRREISDEVILGEDVLFGLPESVPSRPFGAAPVNGQATAAGTVVMRLETADRVSQLSGFYLSTSRALRNGKTLAMRCSPSSSPASADRLPPGILMPENGRAASRLAGWINRPPSSPTAVRTSPCASGRSRVPASSCCC